MEGIGINRSCACPDCFEGETCEVDGSYCSRLLDYCMNGGTFVDGYGCEDYCDCTGTFKGERCETVFCPDGWCYNGGYCSLRDNSAVCDCELEFLGDRCEFQYMIGKRNLYNILHMNNN